MPATQAARSELRAASQLRPLASPGSHPGYRPVTNQSCEFQVRLSQPLSLYPPTVDR